MLRIARASTYSRATLAPVTPKRQAHGVHYGPDEPLGYYIKWIAVVGAFGGVLVYDRFYSDRAISKLVTSETDVAAIEQQRQKYADNVIQDQARDAEMLYPRKRRSFEVYAAHPVPAGSTRDKYSNNVMDVETIGERRPRTKPYESAV